MMPPSIRWMLLITLPVAGLVTLDSCDWQQDAPLGNMENSGRAKADGKPPRLIRTLPQGDGEGIVRREEGWLRGDLHLHSNYSDDAREQGGDWVGASLRIAEYYADPVFQNAFPAYQDNQLDFLALTDHRTTEGCNDPEFYSDQLILLCGEEFGSTGHANALNISSSVWQNLPSELSENEKIQWGIDQTVAQGGLFSINHPVADDDMWFWEVSGYEAMEVWNSFWALLGPPTPESVLDEHVANYGVENRFIRRAIQQEGQGVAGQYLAYYNAHLTAGIPLAAVGGGDRHMLLLPGQPTTYVLAEEATPAGIIDGIRRRRTFVSRSPVGPQALLEARIGNQAYGTGDALPLGQTIQLSVRVGRADRGRLLILSGPIRREISKEELLEIRWLSDVLWDVVVTGDDFLWEDSWTPQEESWVYAMVLEDADYAGEPDDVQADLDLLLKTMRSYGMRYGQLVAALLPFLNVSDLLFPQGCDPTDWDTHRTACVDVDDVPLGTIHMSEATSRILNIYREDDVIWQYAMGAITSPMTVEGAQVGQRSSSTESAPPAGDSASDRSGSRDM